MTPEQKRKQLQDIANYKLLMDKVYELTRRRFEGDNLLHDSKFYLELIEEIKGNELISGKEKHFQKPEQSEELKKLISDISSIKKDRFYPTAVITALSVVAASTIAALALSVKGLENASEDENEYFNISTVTLNAVSSLAAIAGLVGYVVDNNKEKSQTQHLTDDLKSQLALKARESVTQFIKNLHKIELDRLINNEPRTKIENESRIKYWEDLCRTALGGARNIKDLLTDKEEKINLIYARVAIASYYSMHPHKDKTKVEAISNENLEIMHNLAGIDSSLSTTPERITAMLRNVDPRLPTLYAKASYQLGRVATIKWQKDGADEYLSNDEREALKPHLENACIIRGRIDNDEDDRYDDYFSNKQPSDSLLFHRSGLLEYKLGDAHRAIELQDDESKEIAKKSLEELLVNYQESKEAGQIKGGSFLNQVVCEEKMINVISLLVDIIDDSEEKLVYTKQAKEILFSKNEPTTDNLSKLIITNDNNPNQNAKSILRSAVKYASILRGVGNKEEAREIEAWVSNNEEVLGGEHPEVQIAIHQSPAPSPIPSSPQTNNNAIDNCRIM